MDSGRFIFILVLIVVVSIGSFLLVRSIVLWYWKIDKIVENQETQIEQLQRLAVSLEQLLNHKNT